MISLYRFNASYFSDNWCCIGKSINSVDDIDGRDLAVANQVSLDPLDISVIESAMHGSVAITMKCGKELDPLVSVDSWLAQDSGVLTYYLEVAIEKERRRRLRLSR